MADVYTFIASTGTIESDAGAILTQVADEYKNTFGQDLVVPDSTNIEGASTPQGLLIVSEALARIAVADNNVALANQINPNIAGGIFLDAILALTGIQRFPATYSTVVAVFTGVVGTSIPAGSQAQTAAGDLFATTTTVVIPDGGTLTGVAMQAVNSGAIPCDTNDLTSGNGGSIVSNVLGWETIASNAQANLGSATQSDVAARALRLNTLASQGSSVAGAITAGVSLVPGVTSLSFLENPTSAPANLPTGDPSPVAMVANSIYLCVNGGSNGTKSTAIVTITGTPSTSVPAGFKISETFSGYAFVFTLDATTVIPGGGSIDASFTAFSTGTIAAPAGTLTTIVVPLSGVASVTNALPAIVGTESAIADALVSKKSAGAAYNNTAGASQGIPISAVVQVPFSGQLMTILYDNPTPVVILVAITVTIVTPVQNPVDVVKQAIVNYCLGLISGIPGLTVGQSVSAFELGGAVTSQYPGIFVSSVLIAKSPTTPTSSNEIFIELYQIATIAANNISVTIL